MWQALTTPVGTDSALSRLAVLYLLLFALGFAGSVLVANDRLVREGAGPATRDAIRRAAARGVGVFGAGLFFFGVRVLQINPFGFGMPLWLALCAIAALCWLAAALAAVRRATRKDATAT